MAEEGNESGEDLEAMGLIGHSYDNLFSIRKRIRKINDIQIPLRSGLTTTQIGIGLLAFIFQVITLGLFVIPIFNFFTDGPPWHFVVLWVFGPPVLAAQNIVKPMPFGKSIPGTVTSLLRSVLDDRTHRRGMPIPPKRQPEDLAVAHYQREWVMFEDHLDEEDEGEKPISDLSTERRFEYFNRSSKSEEPLDFQKWWDDKAGTHLKELEEQRQRVEDTDREEIGSRRGRSAGVIIPEEMEARIK